MTIDILLSVALRGGVENIIRMLLDTIESPDMHFRIVQLVWEGDRWLPDTADYYPLLKGKGDYSLQQFVEAYQHFLEENGCPDLTLATVWPYNNYVAKKAFANLGEDRKVVSWMHHGIDEYRKTGMGAEEWLVHADAHLAINRENQTELTTLFPEDPVLRLHNPIRFPDESSCKTEYNTDTDQVTLAFVGRLSVEKNLEYIIRTLQKNDFCRLIVIGSAEDISYGKKLRSLAASLGVSAQIDWLGWKSDPWADAIRADALCLSSRYEGFPLVALEALAHGLPVLSSTVNGIDELIRPGENGYIYDLSSEDALTDTIIKFKNSGKLIDHAGSFRRGVSAYDSKLALTDMKEKLLSIMA